MEHCQPIMEEDNLLIRHAQGSFKKEKSSKKKK